MNQIKTLHKIIQTERLKEINCVCGEKLIALIKHRLINNSSKLYIENFMTFCYFSSLGLVLVSP